MLKRLNKNSHRVINSFILTSFFIFFRVKLNVNGSDSDSWKPADSGLSISYKEIKRHIDAENKNANSTK